MNVSLQWLGKGSFRVVLAAVIFVLTTGAADALVIFTYSGTSSIGTPVSFEADLTISGDTLTVQLFNNSPVNSLGPNDALASFYFDILGAANTRPPLTYLSGIGDVYLGSRNTSDPLQSSNANLKATSAGDKAWQFKTMNAGLTPLLGFGIGTVGNNNLSPNSFNGNIVDGLDYAIYRNEVTTQNLNGKLLVKDTATFTFAGLSGFTEADILPKVAFGLGTAPDSLKTGMIIPEPGSITLAIAGVVVLTVFSRRRG
jgi:hypothetical protein